MKSFRQMSQGEMAAFIDSHLKMKGIMVVLSGGACAAIYSDYHYISKDLDFIARFSLDHQKIAEVMSELGFTRTGKYYTHADTEYFVEFISGPLSIGDEPVTDILELEFSTGTLRILSPTESVRDRLAAYYHWKDLQCLEQAVLIATHQVIDIKKIKTWSFKEGQRSEFDTILKRLGTRIV